MKKAAKQDNTLLAEDHLKEVVMTTSSRGLFLSLVGTFFVWAGVNAFNCSEVVWKAALTINLSCYALTWIIYLKFRNTDYLIGKGLVVFLLFFNLFWLFGFAMFYFYFLFAPINSWARAIALISMTLVLMHRAISIHHDIKSALKAKQGLFDRIYYNNGESIIFNTEAFGVLQEARKDRNPFKSFYIYAAMFITPFVLVLNRLLSPIMGDGHGVFAVTAFFSVPILQWGVEIFVQTTMTTIYYPIKLQLQTGKPVLLKDW
jgi:hypothetical protein